MRKLIAHIKIFSIFIFLFITISSCKEKEEHGGAKGTIQVGEGSCAQPIDYSTRYYYNYNGYAYFIPAAYQDSLTSISIEELKHNSDSTSVANGEFTIALDPGTYMVYLQESKYSAVYDNKITIFFEKVTEQDFKFWHCTSY
ncbi:MAG: hypothetical protein Kow0068_17130 [Marinilabiliales bacterium]